MQRNVVLSTLVAAALAIAALLVYSPWPDRRAAPISRQTLAALRREDASLRARVGKLEVRQAVVGSAVQAWLNCEHDNSLPVQRFVNSRAVPAFPLTRDVNPGRAYLDVASLYTVGSGQDPNIDKTAYSLLVSVAPTCSDALVRALGR